MNTEDLQKDKATPEVINKPEITSLEQNKDSKESANEILSKIDEEFSLIPNNKEEIEKVESSILLENQSTKNEIKNELNLENKLNELGNEEKIAREEARSKISQIVGFSQENKLELSEFSKRYSLFYRKQIAQKINNLRFQYRTKLKEKPAEIESIKFSISNEQLSVGEITRQKICEERIQKNLQEQKEKLQSEIEAIRANLDKRKKTFLYKIQNLLMQDKLNEEEASILSDVDIKTKSLERVHSSLRAQERYIKDKNDDLERLKTVIAKKYKLINEAEEVINSDHEIKEIEKTVADFYNEMVLQKGKLESETGQRSVAEISKKKDVMFCHTVPLEIVTDNGFSQNNQLISTNKFGPTEKIKMILGVEPTISASTIDKTNQTLAGNFGVILKGGQVLSAYAGDAGTLIDEGIYNRKSKYDQTLNTSIIQPDIEKNLTHAVGHLQKRDPGSNGSVETMHQGWNELVVENPQVAGLFFQNDNPKNGGNDLEKAKKVSKDLNLPLYILANGKFSQIDEEIKSMKEIDRESIFNAHKNISEDEKRELIAEMIDKESFNVKRDNIYKFNAYNVGKAYFRFIKRVDAGEKVSIRPLGEKEVLGEGDERIQLVDEAFAIKTNRLTEKQWELFGKEDWEKYETYHRDNAPESRFNTKFTGRAVWEPSSNFIMNGDGISSYIDMAERELDRISEQGKESKKKNKEMGDILIFKKSIVYIIFGFAEECKTNNDNKNYEKAMGIIGKFSTVSECEAFIKDRIGKDGKFQYLTEDVPIEVRKKLNNS